MSALASRVWWVAAGRRAARTALVVLAPFLPALLAPTPGVYAAAASTVALAVVLSLVMSLRSLPELDGLARPWWASTLDRAVRTFFQVLLAGVPAVTLLEAVPWPALLAQAATSALGSVILAAIAALPEAQPVTVPAADVYARVDAAGQLVTGDASSVGPGVVLGTDPRHLAAPHA